MRFSIILFAASLMVQASLLPGICSAQEKTTDPEIRLANGVPVKGTFKSAGPEGLTLQSAKGATVLPWKYLSAGTRWRYERPMLEAIAKADEEARKAAAAEAAQSNVYDTNSIPALAVKPAPKYMDSQIKPKQTQTIRMEDAGQQILYQSGRDGYHTYRCPALAVTKQGTVLAFAEGRKEKTADDGWIDVLVKRSIDNGTTWSRQKLIWNDKTNTCANLSPVVDRDTGVIWLLMNWSFGDDNQPKVMSQTSRDMRRVFVTSSTDDGFTWAKPRDITTDVKPTNWLFYATGPGAGIQLRKAPYAGRLIIPCDYSLAGTYPHYPRYSHVIYSDDHGKSWRLGGATPKDITTECVVVEMVDGRLMLNMRSRIDRGSIRLPPKTRQVAFSRDGGLTWEDQHFDQTLIESICQASIIRYAWPVPGRSGLILFANPASEDARVNMTLRASCDDGVTWPFKKTLYEGPSAYSDLAVLKNGKIACAFESGEKGPYERITFARLSIKWLE